MFYHEFSDWSSGFDLRNPSRTRAVSKGMKLGLLAFLAFVACTSTVNVTSGSPALPVDWTVHEAAGLRIATPAAWLGPEVLPALESAGPRAWIMFRDPSGTEAVTLMTWRDTTASALAREQYQGEIPKGDAPADLTLVEGALTRTVIALTGFAQWSDTSGSGHYECRHLYVQVDPTLVAAVIACGAHVRETSTPTPELRRTQERVALRLTVSGARP